MNETKQTFDWQQALVKTYEEVAQNFVEHIPQLLGAFLLLIAGLVAASLLRILARKILRGLDTLLARAALKRGVRNVAPRSYAKFGGDIAYWSTLIFFIAASGNMLELQIFSSITKAWLVYLPNVVTGLLIILIGFALSGITRSAVASTMLSAGIAHSDVLARITQITVVLTAVVIGVEQLGINVAFISTTLVVTAGVLLGGVALAFGLGAKYFVANIIGAQITRKHFHIGQKIRFGAIEGFILEITSTTLIIDTSKGRAAIPAHLLQRDICEIVDDVDDLTELGEPATQNNEG
jgi:hypothetical protein